MHKAYFPIALTSCTVSLVLLMSYVSNANFQSNNDMQFSSLVGMVDLCVFDHIFLNTAKSEFFYCFAVVNMLLIITTATTATTTVLVVGVIVLLSLLSSSLSSQGRLSLKYGFFFKFVRHNLKDWHVDDVSLYQISHIQLKWFLIISIKPALSSRVLIPSRP
jgi:hypothetical protein